MSGLLSITLRHHPFQQVFPALRQPAQHSTTVAVSGGISGLTQRYAFQWLLQSRPHCYSAARAGLSSGLRHTGVQQGSAGAVYTTFLARPNASALSLAANAAAMGLKLAVRELWQASAAAVARRAPSPAASSIGRHALRSFHQQTPAAPFRISTSRHGRTALYRHRPASGVVITRTAHTAGTLRTAVCGVAAVSAPSSSVHAYRQLRAARRWSHPRDYLLYVNQLLINAMAPYWSTSAQWASAFQSLYHQTFSWLPSLPSARAHAYMFTINALYAAGSHLPRLLVFSVAEMSSTANSRAQAFEFYVDVPQTALQGASGIVGAAIRAGSACYQALKLLWLVMLFTPVGLFAPFALWMNVGRHDWFVLLRQTLEYGGPAFIKWGQWAATRVDIFPPDMCKQLGQLQTQAPGHSFKYTKRYIESAFGISLAELFDEFGKEPMASGSIGQIHRALLSKKGALITGFPEGTALAVKVRHPGVGDAILRDFKTMLWVASLLNRLPALEHLQLVETLSQFAAPLQEQVDLSREAANLRRFNHNFRGARDVEFPVPLYPLVTADVLVETFQEGDHITNYIAADQNPWNARLSELGAGLMLQMMLVDNLIHSDLHPGNILVRLEPPAAWTLLGTAYRVLDTIRRSGQVGSTTRARIYKVQSGWLQPKMVLLDVGMTTELTPRDQVNMLGLFRAFAAMDGDAVADWTLAFSGDQQTCPNPDAFRLGIVHMFDVIQNSGGGHALPGAAQQPFAPPEVDSTGEVVEFSSSAAALSAVLEMVRQHKVSLPGHVCAVVVTTLVLEGWSSQLDPDHSVLSMVRNMFQDHVAWRNRIDKTVDVLMNDLDNDTLM